MKNKSKINKGKKLFSSCSSSTETFTSCGKGEPNWKELAKEFDEYYVKRQIIRDLCDKTIKDIEEYLSGKYNKLSLIWAKSRVKVIRDLSV